MLLALRKLVQQSEADDRDRYKCQGTGAERSRLRGYAWDGETASGKFGTGVRAQKSDRLWFCKGRMWWTQLA